MKSSELKDKLKLGHLIVRHPDIPGLIEIKPLGSSVFMQQQGEEYHRVVEISELNKQGWLKKIEFVSFIDYGDNPLVDPKVHLWKTVQSSKNNNHDNN